MNYRLELSVHQLVDFLLRRGDIDNRVYNQETMAEGTRIHSAHQSKQGKRYLSEYPLRGTFNVRNFEIILEGRADGIIVADDGYTVDEIKSTIAPLEEFYLDQKDWHLGQAQCYALMFAMERDIEHVNIQLTYIHQLDKSKLIKVFEYTRSELEEIINQLLNEYIDFYEYILERTKRRNKSIKNLQFPFDNFRDGQRELSKYSYSIADKGGTLFVEAPTGIGKTISTLYPYVKSLANEENDKIFYLTAKNSGKETAFNMSRLLQDHGMLATPIIITAKDQICFCPGKSCNPDECPFAKGYYTNLRKAIVYGLDHYQYFDQQVISEIATKYAICPFEFSLDLSLFSDIIVCDYNYFFDPLVYLKRYFDETYSNKLILVDEAHNLIERARSMYSVSISCRLFKKVQRSCSNLNHKKIKNAFKRISKLFNEFKEFEDGQTRLEFLEGTHLRGIEAYLLASSDVMKHHSEFVSEEFKDFFLELNKFSKLYNFFDDSYVLYVDKEGDKDIHLHLFCLDPSAHLKASFDKVKSKTIFSATLTPSYYYVKSIGGSKKDPFLHLPSPFPYEHLHVMIAPTVSVKYRKREQTLEEVASYIKAMIKGRVGNYFVYVPSFEYLDQIASYLESDEYDVIPQVREMSEEEKHLFLSVFVDRPKRTTVGLVVVGGAFGEGIDLVSERLIGVAVVGVGMPTICYERNLIKDYYNQQNQDGYHFAYTYPGMNRVMQAVGRVIRGDTDRGVALLIDDRYLNKQYRDIFREEWRHYEVVTSPSDVSREVEKFWTNNK